MIFLATMCVGFFGATVILGIAGIMFLFTRFVPSGWWRLPLFLFSVLLWLGGSFQAFDYVMTNMGFQYNSERS